MPGFRRPALIGCRVTTHLATLDLMALGDVLCNSAGRPAAPPPLLRSPLFEDFGRPISKRWAQWPARQNVALVGRCVYRPSRRLQAAFPAAARTGAAGSISNGPFNFYAMVLYSGGAGLRKISGVAWAARSTDVFAEFLELALPARAIAATVAARLPGPRLRSP